MRLLPAENQPGGDAGQGVSAPRTTSAHDDSKTGVPIFLFRNSGFAFPELRFSTAESLPALQQ
jgi:hypothetical protein